MAEQIKFKLGELISGVSTEFSDIIITGIQADSRKVTKGDLFFALSGSLANGADYAKSAEEKGALAVISETAIDGLSIPVIIVGDARGELSNAAKSFYPEMPKNIVAITGTNGKSSTVDFLRQIWAYCGKNSASLGTLGAITPKGVVNLGFTTPDPISLHRNLQVLAEDGVDYLAMEASSHALHQKRMHGVTLKAAGFSNLTQDHLDYHKTMDEYAAAKAILFTDFLKEGQPAVINADAEYAPYFENVAKEHNLDLKLVGWRGTYLKIQELWPKPSSQRIDYIHAGKNYVVELPLIGEFQALNATMAAGLALSLGDEPEAVFAAMRKLKPVKGRMEHVGETKDNAHVFVDYAHTPDGLDVLLRAVRPHAPGRIIVVFGCGGDRDKTKRPKMGAIAAKYGDVVIVTDDNPRTEDANQIRKEIMIATPDAYEIGDRKEAIIFALKMSKNGDAVIVAGKGHETGQIVGDKVLPFSDQETIIDYLLENGGKIV
ncbi:UDP-N-acetylmuramoyl-L-alanyl-D-glutamate--2,6-diaminopimelate ligase [Pseudaquidulcibacter saccharophilus]|uniref:UDP-N-acetylmuramoyl-L-alanyl-D-glutamate--2, 6-diaminopimelate ligase n=1 Tax=Pseudaquidulcibacter saccharophilus TaxID=2831900 RepID=UPI001EFF48C2|nr:UDP-N-acetylmuramoyl-L-alanyl-D-glutamate--2,6-diaminopimelate ligase [Pseudaquidulcibacter saccharophilus]